MTTLRVIIAKLERISRDKISLETTNPKALISLTVSVLQEDTSLKYF